MWKRRLDRKQCCSLKPFIQAEKQAFKPIVFYAWTTTTKTRDSKIFNQEKEINWKIVRLRTEPELRSSSVSDQNLNTDHPLYPTWTWTQIILRLRPEPEHRSSFVSDLNLNSDHPSSPTWTWTQIILRLRLLYSSRTWSQLIVCIRPEPELRSSSVSDQNLNCNDLIILISWI